MLSCRLRQMNWKKFLVNLIMVFVVICLLGAGYSIYYLISNPHLLDKLSAVMSNNMNFWLIMVAGFFYGLWRKFKNPQEFTFSELPVQLIVGIIATIGIFGAFLFWSSGLQDSEIWNGRVLVAEYYEEWTEEETYYEEECTGSGDNRSCRDVKKTRNVYHPPEWQLSTSNGEIVSISKGTYRKYVGKFANEKEVNLSRMDQVSFGDGDKYITKWPGTENTLIPSAVSHEYVNYLKASKSLHKRSGTTQTYANLLRPYPTVTGGQFGSIEFNRVIGSGISLPQQWKQTVDREIDKALSTLGSQRQVNLLVYVVKSSDRGFIHALEEHWVYGKKNDVVLILGMNNFPKVEWASVMIFHGNEDLCVKLRDTIEAKVDISDPKEFAQIFIKHVQLDFERVPMEELEHLLHDIEMPWWAIIIVWIIVGMVVFVISQILENNSTRNHRRRWRS